MNVAAKGDLKRSLDDARLQRVAAEAESAARAAEAALKEVKRQRLSAAVEAQLGGVTATASHTAVARRSRQSRRSRGH